MTNSKTFVLPRVGSTRANLRKIVSSFFSDGFLGCELVVPRVVCEVPDGLQFGKHVAVTRFMSRKYGRISVFSEAMASFVRTARFDGCGAGLSRNHSQRTRVVAMRGAAIYFSCTTSSVKCCGMNWMCSFSRVTFPLLPPLRLYSCGKRICMPAGSSHHLMQEQDASGLYSIPAPRCTCTRAPSRSCVVLLCFLTLSSCSRSRHRSATGRASRSSTCRRTSARRFCGD